MKNFIVLFVMILSLSAKGQLFLPTQHPMADSIKWGKTLDAFGALSLEDGITKIFQEASAHGIHLGGVPIGRPLPKNPIQTAELLRTAYIWANWTRIPSLVKEVREAAHGFVCHYPDYGQDLATAWCYLLPSKCWGNGSHEMEVQIIKSQRYWSDMSRYWRENS